MRLRAAALCALAALAAAVGLAGLSGAVFSWRETNPQTLQAASSFATLDLKDAVIVKSAGGDGGAIKPNADYRVYADVAGAGSGATVTADLRNVTSGQTAAPLAAGSYSANGRSWNWRSGVYRSGNFADGTSLSYVVTARDGTQTDNGTFTVKIDNSVPKNTDVQAVNGTGTKGKVDAGDKITLFYTEPVDRPSIDDDWTGTNGAIRVRFGSDLTNNKISFVSADGSQTLQLGTIDTTGDFVSAPTDFQAQVVRNGNNLDVVIGNRISGPSPLLFNQARTFSWNASGQITDPAGNTINGFNVQESGPSDVDF